MDAIEAASGFNEHTQFYLLLLLSLLLSLSVGLIHSMSVCAAAKETGLPRLSQLRMMLTCS
jgi:hypothetical protein